jgi:hypothetical protein
MSFLDPPDNPVLCCLCNSADRHPAHEDQGVDIISWCQNCGRVLTLRQMDEYVLSEAYRDRKLYLQTDEFRERYAQRQRDWAKRQSTKMRRAI